MPTSTEERVISEIEAVFRNKGQAAPALAVEMPLDSSLGLDSLDFAELVVRLEQAFGADPFSAGTIPQIETVRGLARLYE